MKNKQSKIFLMIFSMFLLVFTLNGVYAQPDALPFQELGQGSIVSYEIDFPKLDIAYYNQSFDFNTHLKYNNGTHLKNIIPSLNVTCHLDGYDNRGNNTFHLDLIDLTPGGDVGHFYGFVPESFFNFVGGGYYTLHCEDINDIVGLVSAPFIVEEYIGDDKNLLFDLNKTGNIIVLIIILLGSLLLISIGHRSLSGFIWLLIGLMLMFSKQNIIFSLIITVIGLLFILYKE